MESAIFALLGVLVGGGLVAAGLALAWNLLHGGGDDDIEDAEYYRKVRNGMARAAAFEAGRDHALWLQSVRQFGHHQYYMPPQLDSTEELDSQPRVVYVVVSPEQATALTRA